METMPAPTEAELHEAALTYLARYAATRATLTRALDRRVDRWARAAGVSELAALRGVVRALVARLAAAGAVDDAAFAETRARRLRRSGRSRQAAAAHLAARGIDAQVLRAALPADDAAELAAAVAFARRRRFGPFRRAAAAEGTEQRERAAFARAGFTRAAALAALGMSAERAEALLAAARDA